MIVLVLALVLFAAPTVDPTAPYLTALNFWRLPGGVGCAAACRVPQPDGGTMGPGVGRVEATSQTEDGCKDEMQRICDARAAEAKERERRRRDGAQ